MLFLISENVAALYQRFQHAEINFFVGPFAFGKEGGIFEKLLDFTEKFYIIVELVICIAGKSLLT